MLGRAGSVNRMEGTETTVTTNTNYFKGLSRRDYIEKAHEIIQEEGIEAVSIRRIARELGCSSASLYRHFENLSELLYYAELRTLGEYIKSLNEAEKHWHNMWEVYVGIWDVYSREAFRHPEAYNLLFFEYNNVKLKNSTEEYYKMFPEDIKDTNRFFYKMLRTSDFMSRDFEICKECITSGAITYENAVQLNRIVCLLFKGYFKTVMDEKIRPEEIDGRVEQMVDDIDTIVMMLARDLKGYTGYPR